MNGQRKKKRPGNRRPYQRRVSLAGTEAGMVLMFVLFAILVLSVLGTGFLGLAFNEHQLSRSHRDGTQALYLADLGIERAKSELNQRLDADGTKDNFTAELDQYLFGSAAAHDTFTLGVYQAGQYRVLVTDNDDGDGNTTADIDMTVWATAEGVVTLRGHTLTKRVEALLGPGRLGALTMGCDPPGSGDILTINGNPNIAGSQGSVHSNCNVTISGDPNISQDVTASRTVTIDGGNPTIGGSPIDWADPLDIPEVNPADFKPLADYIMVEDAGAGTAKVYDALGNLVFDATGGGIWPGPKGWKFSGTPGDFGKWETQGNGAAPALLAGKTFYFEKAAGNPPGKSGNVVISSNPGTPGNPWQVTLLAEGHIDISGNPYLRADTEGLLLVAGTDIKVSGNYVQDWPGGIIIAGHEQIAFSGNPEFIGFVVAENAATDDNYVQNTFISGNPIITYDGAPSPPDAWRMSVKVRAWRELP